MPTSIFQRLFWKELRQQRTFWLCVFGGGLFLLPLAYISKDFERTRSAYWFGVSTYLPILFALGSCAMSFALEREDGTDVLLCRLASPPGKLFAAKLLFALVATLAMWVVLSFVAAVLFTIEHGFAAFWATMTDVRFVFWRHVRFNRHTELRRQIHEHAPIAVAWLAQFAAWGTLLSLVSRRVTNGLVGALVASAFTIPLISWMVAEQLRGTWILSVVQIGRVADVCRIGLVPLLLFAISAWLVRRWPEERWPAAIELSLEHLRRWATRRDHVAAREREMLDREQTLRATVRSLGVPQAEQISRDRIVDLQSSLVTSRAGWGWLIRDDRWSPSTRAATRLLWVEMRRAKKVVLIAVAICVGLLVLSAALPNSVRLGTPLDGHALPILLLLLCSFACGLSTFLPEHRQFPFLTHHAVSPTRVWGLKQLVWWPAAVLISTLTYLVVAATHAAYVRAEDWRAAFGEIEGIWLQTGTVPKTYGEVLQYFLVSPWAEQPMWLTADEQIAAHSYFWWIIVCGWLEVITASFLIGQFLSVVLPRGVAAGVLGLFLIALGSAWCMFMMILHVPLWLSVAPLCVALLLASSVRCRAWMEEWSRWRTTARVGLALLLPALATYCGFGWYRVAEVPDLRWSKVVGNSRWMPLSSEHPLAASTDYVAEMKKFRIEVMQRVPDMPPISHLEIETRRGARNTEWYRITKWNRIWNEHHLNGEVADWAREHAELARALVDISRRTDFGFFDASRALAPWYFHFQWVTDRLEAMALLLRLDAIELANSGQWDESLDRVRALFRLSDRERQGGGTQQLLMSLHIQIAALDALAFWASQPNITAERLEQAQQLLPKPSLNVIWLVTEALNVDRQLYGRLFDHAWSEQTGLRLIRWMAPWERVRSRRVLELSVANEWQLALNGDVSANWSNSGYGGFRHMPSETRRATNKIIGQRMAALADRSAGLNSPAEYDRMSLVHRVGLDQLQELFNAVEARRFGCQLLLALRTYRLRHDRLPEVLDELVGRELTKWGDPYLDLWRERAVSYWPDGLPVTISFENRTVAEGTPCVFLGGRWRFQLRRVPVESNGERPDLQWNVSTMPWSKTPDGVPITDAVAYPLPP